MSKLSRKIAGDLVGILPGDEVIAVLDLGGMAIKKGTRGVVRFFDQRDNSWAVEWPKCVTLRSCGGHTRPCQGYWCWKEDIRLA